MHIHDGRVVSNFIVQALRNESITIYGDGLQTRSFCYVDDMIDGIARLMNVSDECTQPVNLGNPADISILGLAREILEITGSRSRLTYLPLPENDPKKSEKFDADAEFGDSFEINVADSGAELVVEDASDVDLNGHVLELTGSGDISIGGENTRLDLSDSRLDATEYTGDELTAYLYLEDLVTGEVEIGAGNEEYHLASALPGGDDPTYTFVFNDSDNGHTVIHEFLPDNDLLDFTFADNLTWDDTKLEGEDLLVEFAQDNDNTIAGIDYQDTHIGSIELIGVEPADLTHNNFVDVR